MMIMQKHCCRRSPAFEIAFFQLDPSNACSNIYLLLRQGVECSHTTYKPGNMPRCTRFHQVGAPTIAQRGDSRGYPDGTRPEWASHTVCICPDCQDLVRRGLPKGYCDHPHRLDHSGHWCQGGRSPRQIPSNLLWPSRREAVLLVGGSSGTCDKLYFVAGLVAIESTNSLAIIRSPTKHGHGHFCFRGFFHYPVIRKWRRMQYVRSR